MTMLRSWMMEAKHETNPRQIRDEYNICHRRSAMAEDNTTYNTHTRERRKRTLANPPLPLRLSWTALH